MLGKLPFQQRRDLFPHDEACSLRYVFNKCNGDSGNTVAGKGCSRIPCRPFVYHERMKKYLILALILIGAGTAAAYVATRPLSTSEEAPAAGTQTYENADYGYAVSYPESLAVREYAGGNTAFGTEEGELFLGAAEVRVITVEGAAGESLQEAAARELSNLCAADGPGQSFSCTGVAQVEPFTATDGRRGYALYLKGEMTNLATNAKTAYSKGPFFVFPLQMSATMGRALVVHPPLNMTTDEADATLIRAIAKSVTVTEAAPASASVEAYIAANLAKLSPLPEVLGGTFYVTAIEASDGRGSVSYEDGHHAYVADFTYTVEANGAITVTSFSVREQ